MVLSKIDQEIKALLKERNNLPLNNKEIPKIHRKRELLRHLKAHRNNIAYFNFMPVVCTVQFVSEYDINELPEARDMVKNFTFVGSWEGERR